jgi:flagellar basal-body rod protein FlgF
MENLSYIGLSRQLALRSLMDVTANNIANMNTPGFKAQNIQFREYLNKTPAEGEKISQVRDAGTYRDLGQGVLSPTYNKLDVAVQGDGYFAVQTPEGTRYTRAGSFSLNSNGEIVTKTGYQVLSDGGSPLAVQPGAANITISEGGTVSSEKGSIGKLKLVTFEDEKGIKAMGDNLYSAGSTQEVPVEKPQVVQGMLENSNVQPVVEMNKMIELLRMYQSTQNMLITDHELMRGMIQKLTKV